MKPIKIAILALSLVVLAYNAWAVETDYQSAMSKTNVFIRSVDQVINSIINDDSLGDWVEALWLFFAGIMLVPALLRWSRNAQEIDAVLFHTIMILVTGLMLHNYHFLTGLVWDVYEGVAGGIQTAVVGSSDPFFFPSFIHDIMKAIDQTGLGFWEGVKLLMASQLLMPTIVVLSVVAFFVNVWTLWGFAVAKISGFFVIPFLLSKRFSYIFDGWVRLLIGFVVYGIIARINLVLTALLMRTFFQLPSYKAPAAPIPFTIEALPQMVGLLSFLIIAIVALIQTGKFAQSIVSSAVGLGSGIRNVARTATGKVLL